MAKNSGQIRGWEEREREGKEGEQRGKTEGREEEGEDKREVTEAKILHSRFYLKTKTPKPVKKTNLKKRTNNIKINNWKMNSKQRNLKKKLQNYRTLKLNRVWTLKEIKEGKASNRER